MSTWFTEEFKRELRDRVPDSLDDLRGPAEGVIELPLRIGRWDLAEWKQRVGLYHELIVDCRKGEPERYIDRGHFVELWPYIRCCVCDGYSSPWEEKFPELRHRASIDTSIYDPRADEPFRLKTDWMS